MLLSEYDLDGKGVAGAMARVLVIDSDSTLRVGFASALTGFGHEVETASTSIAGATLARLTRPDVVVFDLVLSDGTGIDLCRTLREQSSLRAALLVLSSVDGEELRVAAFEAGVDDYVVKPPSIRELELRIRALARRSQRPPPTEVLALGAMRIDRAARRVDVAGADVVLTRREFDVLLCLAERAGRVQTRQAVVAQVWGELVDAGRIVDTTIKRVRKKLGAAAPAIRTVRGVGYKLE